MTSTYWVRDVLDGNTLVVEPSWAADGFAGSVIRVTGLRVPPLHEPLGGLVRTQVMLLLLGSPIRITHVHGVRAEVLECDVSSHGRDLRSHFPRYAIWDTMPLMPPAPDHAPRVPATSVP